MNTTRTGGYVRTVLLNCGPIAHLDYEGNSAIGGSMVSEVENLVSDLGGILIEEKVINSIMSSEELESEFLSVANNSPVEAPSIIQSSDDVTVWDVAGRAVLPGFVDAHTHLLWAGDRSREVLWRQEGFSYSEIADMGGGIGHTVQSTRLASEKQILSLGIDRMKTALRYGTTMIEAKSGYGLDTETELKLINCANRLAESEGLPSLDLTWLGAHATPPNQNKQTTTEERVAYVEEIISEQLPAVISQGMARSSDVFCEPGWFTIEETEDISKEARNGGLDIRLHVDEFCDGGGMKLAAELGATTADHTHYSQLESRFEAMENGTLQGFLLGTPHVMGFDMPPVIDCIENQIPFTIATDFNPNCNTLSMPFIGSLAVQRCGVDPLTALIGATRNPATGIVRRDGLEQGTLRTGSIANINILKSNNWESWCAQPGMSPIHTTLISGRRAHIEDTVNIK